MYILRLAGTFRHLQPLTGGEQAGLMGTDSITPRLQERCRTTEVRAFERDNAVAIHIGRRQMPILAVRHEEGVAHLVGFHPVLLVVQTGIVALDFIEREIQVVAIVSKDGRQIVPQGLQEIGISLLVELLLQFDRQVGD